MKAIQVTLDESLLAELSRHDEVKQRGRSAIIREATRQWLLERQRRQLADAYHQAYAESGPELENWAEEGQWPED